MGKLWNLDLAKDRKQTIALGIAGTCPSCGRVKMYSRKGLRKHKATFYGDTCPGSRGPSVEQRKGVHKRGNP